MFAKHVGLMSPIVYLKEKVVYWISHMEIIFPHCLILQKSYSASRKNKKWVLARVRFRSW